MTVIPIRLYESYSSVRINLLRYMGSKAPSFDGRLQSNFEVPSALWRDKLIDTDANNNAIMRHVRLDGAYYRPVAATEHKIRVSDPRPQLNFTYIEIEEENPFVDLGGLYSTGSIQHISKPSWSVDDVFAIYSEGINSLWRCGIVPTSNDLTLSAMREIQRYTNMDDTLIPSDARKSYLDKIRPWWGKQFLLQSIRIFNAGDTIFPDGFNPNNWDTEKLPQSFLMAMAYNQLYEESTKIKEIRNTIDSTFVFLHLKIRES